MPKDKDPTKKVSRLELWGSVEYTAITHRSTLTYSSNTY